MKANFADALARVLAHEGGFVDHPRDHGGATNRGITLETYQRYIDPTGTVEDLKAITADEVADVYRDQYWAAVRGNDLPTGVDYAVFDFAANSGPSRAAKFLQAAVGAVQDGHIGPQTLHLTTKLHPKDVINVLCDKRMAFLRNLTTFPTFGRGWSLRVAAVRKHALEMARFAVFPPKPTPAPRKRFSFKDWLTGLLLRKATSHLKTQLKDSQMLNFLPGAKTYVAAALMILLAVASVLGVEVPAIDPANALQTIMEGFAIIFLRRGIKG